ncbi:MAG: ABC transporter ATP-binding protein [Firmicutes bacterium]|nr:ABC transporter ATP-binding protein [Bacillota bacterium]
MIEIKNLNFTYASGKGIFDINFDVRVGQVVGFLGPNGAGKTTTIRCILGFMNGQSGTVTVDGLDAFTMAPQIAQRVGYIAGEPAFPENMTGREFLEFLINARVSESGGTGLDMREMTERMETLLEYFELDSTHKIKRMSKGMKQKTAIISAFLHDPQIYVLDEPSSGLDPLMQAKLIDLLQSEKARGKTILISSHIFEEVERTADRVIIIKDGRIAAGEQVATLKKSQRKVYNLATTEKPEKVQSTFADIAIEMSILENGDWEIVVNATDVNKFIKSAAKLELTDLRTRVITLEEIFMQYYAKNDGGAV